LHSIKEAGDSSLNSNTEVIREHRSHVGGTGCVTCIGECLLYVDPRSWRHERYKTHWAHPSRSASESKLLAAPRL